VLIKQPPHYCPSRMAIAVAWWAVWLRLRSQMDVAAAASLEQFLPLAVQDDVRRAGVAAGDLHVEPAQLGADADAERLGDRLLRAARLGAGSLCFRQ